MINEKPQDDIFDASLARRKEERQAQIDRQNMQDAGAMDRIADKRKGVAKGMLIAKWLLKAPGTLLVSAATTSVLAEAVSDVDFSDKQQIGMFTVGALMGGVSKLFNGLRHIYSEEALAYASTADALKTDSSNGKVSDYRKGAESIKFGDGVSTSRSPHGEGILVVGGVPRPDLTERFNEAKVLVGGSPVIAGLQLGIYPDSIPSHNTSE